MPQRVSGLFDSNDGLLATKLELPMMEVYRLSYAWRIVSNFVLDDIKIMYPLI